MFPLGTERLYDDNNDSYTSTLARARRNINSPSNRE